MTRLVVMGVAGSGKTTVGERVATRLGAAFFDADQAHSAENVAKMAAGIPLSDVDRGPWLARLRIQLDASTNVVVTCSALKRTYREALREAGQVRFAYLRVSPGVAAERVGNRRDHFMKREMVDSQFDALEEPTADEHDVVTIDASGPIDVVVVAIVDAVRSID